MYTIDVNKDGGFSRRNAVGLSTLGESAARAPDAPRFEFYELEAAEVVDIILDSNHSNYSSPRDVGRAKVRPQHSFKDVDDNGLPWALPIDSNIKSYPLKHEIVVVANYTGENALLALNATQLYYTQKLNVFGSINNNAFPNVFSRSPVFIDDNRDQSYADTTDGNIATIDDIEISLGNTFIENLNVGALQPYEGDTLFEGRFGQSIRFGSTVEKGNFWPAGSKVGSPITIIRTGNRDIPTPFLTENINNDDASIWLTSDQKVNLLPAATNFLSYGNDFPDEFSGKQIVINSDRLIFNSRAHELLGFAKKSVGFATPGTFNVDAETATIINSREISLGLNAEEPLVLGNSLVDVLKEILNMLSGAIITTPAGPAPLGTATVSTGGTIGSKVTAIKLRLQNILSQQNKTL